MRRLTATRSSSGRNGLAKRALAAVVSSELPLTTRIGMAAVSGSERKRLMNSSPSIVGIMTSVVTRSGWLALTDFKPARPWRASVTSWPAPSKINRITNRISGSSSTIRILATGPSLFPSSIRPQFGGPGPQRRSPARHRSLAGPAFTWSLSALRLVDRPRSTGYQSAPPPIST
jgi:hypothetical protein